MFKFINEYGIEFHWNLEIDSSSYMLKKNILNRTNSKMCSVLCKGNLEMFIKYPLKVPVWNR